VGECMNFVVPALGVAGLVALVFSSQKATAKAKSGVLSSTPVRVDTSELIKKSSINRNQPKSENSKGLVPKTSANVRVRNANIVLREFDAAGIPLAIGLAALVNACYESRLTAALGDSSSGKPASFGLFQLNIYGAGRGMSAEEMLDPKTNTKRIIEDYNKNGQPLVDAYKAGSSVATLSGLFGKYIERPSDREGALTKRANYARQLFPTIADLPGKDLYE